jgi:hypothetical protein
MADPSARASAPPALQIPGSDVPPDYSWAGVGAIPPDLYNVAHGLAGILGAVSVMPDASNTAALGEILGGLWQILETQCGIPYATIVQTINANAPRGPDAVTYALQSLMLAGPCASLVKSPIAAPSASAPAAGAMTTTSSSSPTTPGGIPTWAWLVGGAGVLTLLGVGVYFATRRRKSGPRRRSNPCGACNPSPRRYVKQGMGRPIIIETKGVPRGGWRKVTNPRKKKRKATVRRATKRRAKKRAQPKRSKKMRVVSTTTKRARNPRRGSGRNRKGQFMKGHVVRARRGRRSRRNPYGGTRGSSSVDPQELQLVAPFRRNTINSNPRKKRRKVSKRRK